MTKIKSFLEEGDFIGSDDKSILVAAGLAKFLNVKVNDTLVLFSSGYHGATAAGLYPVKGILKLPFPDMNRSTVYLSIIEAQSFFSTGNQFTGLVFDIKNIDDVNRLSVENKISLEDISLRVIKVQESANTLNEQLGLFKVE